MLRESEEYRKRADSLYERNLALIEGRWEAEGFSPAVSDGYRGDSNVVITGGLWEDISDTGRVGERGTPPC